MKEAKELKKKFKERKGITLIALVITIIVLLILAGVSIMMLTGDNSILQKATEAKEKTRDETQREALNLAILGVLSNSLGQDEITKTKLEEELNKSSEAGNFEITEEGSYLLVSFTGGKTYRVNKNGTIGEATITEQKIAGDEITVGDITIKLSISGTRVSPPPMPSGFTHKEGTISDGYVITDGNNEFVWIPVDQNQKIKLEVIANENISSIKLYDPLGTPTSYTATGTSYENAEIVPTQNGVYVATAITTSGKAATKTLQVQSLYSKTINGLTDESIERLNMGPKSIREAEIAFASQGNNIDGFISNLYTQMNTNNSYVDYEDTVDYRNSVKNNSGFYIGRYEAGATNKRTTGNSNATVASIISENGKPTSKANQTPYNNITLDQAKGLAESVYTGKSDLLTGSAWDRTLGFLSEAGTNNKTLSQTSVNSGEWGNYENVSFDITNTSAKYSDNYGGSYTPITETYTKEADTPILLTTGAENRNSAKNIYDLAGNVWEWVNQRSSNSDKRCVIRGGSYSSSSTSETEYDSYNGFRLALYL